MEHWDGYFDRHHDDGEYPMRVLELYMFNRSSIKQVVTVEDVDVLWPRQWKKFYTFTILEVIEFEPYSGGNVPIVLGNHDWLNDTPERRAEIENPPFTIGCLVRAKISTLSGHRVNYIGRAELHRFSRLWT
jgi:hypothetical protein